MRPEPVSDPILKNKEFRTFAWRYFGLTKLTKFGGVPGSPSYVFILPKFWVEGYAAESEPVVEPTEEQLARDEEKGVTRVYEDRWVIADIEDECIIIKPLTEDELLEVLTKIKPKPKEKKSEKMGDSTSLFQIGREEIT